MFLDSGEIVELTKRVHHSAQAKVLTHLGIEHKVRPDGSLAVLASHAEEVLSGAKAKRKTAATEPNWGALSAARA